MFAVIEFEERAELAIVHTKWFTPRKKEVFWPPYKDVNIFNKALKKGEDIDEEKWQIFPVARLFYETDDLEKAKKKIKLAELTSDLGSEEEVVQRRISKRPVRYSSDEENNIQYERPPKINRKNVAAHISQPIDNQPLINLRHGSDCNTPNSPQQFAYDDSNRSTPSTSISNNDDLNRMAFEKKLLEAIVNIKEQNNQILSALKKNIQSAATYFCLPENLPVQLPLTKQADVEALEKYLSDSDHMSALTIYLSSLGGRDVTFRTNRILKHLLNDEIAAEYSFYGKRMQKKPFCTLLLKTSVIRAIKASVPDSSEKQIEDCVKVWLKHAPQRVKNSKKQK